MWNLKIRTKMYLLCGLYSVVGLGSTLLLLHRTSTLYDQLNVVQDSRVSQQDAVQEMQLNFKKQVQEWENILLRGSDPQSLEKYRQGFFREEAAVKKSAEELQKSMTDPQVRTLLARFVHSHEQLGDSYREALAIFTKGGAKDFQAADRVVARQDREPASSIDEILVLLNQDAEKYSKSESELLQSQRNTTILATGILWLALIILAVFLTRSILGPLKMIADMLGFVAAGDLTRRLQFTGNDEIAQMGGALNRTLEVVGDVMKAIGESSHALASSSEELSSVSHEMSSNAEETSVQANVVAAAAEQVTKNMHTVATSTEEMTASIREIAKNAHEAAKVATAAVRSAEMTNTTMSKLGESSGEIGQVVKVITSIAQQTNLLALNATIEAARAGEAGKGFAVVANEVKELAKETANATEDISRKIGLIQGNTQEAIDTIVQIGLIIGQINDISNTIASAVEEQAATTNEIARNVAEAVRGSSQVTENITSVATAAQSTTSGAAGTQQAAGALARMAAELQQLVERFKYEEDIRSAHAFHSGNSTHAGLRSGGKRPSKLTRSGAVGRDDPRLEPELAEVSAGNGRG